MKRIFVFLLLIIVTSGAFAQTISLQPNSVPVNPYLAGQGGSFTANSHGYNSLFKNPAGFAMEDGDFTLMSNNVWGFIDQSLIDFAMNPEAAQAGLTTQLEAVDEAAVTEWFDGKTEEQLVGYLEEAGFDTDEIMSDPQTYIDQKLQELESDPETVLQDEQLAAATINLANTVVQEITGEELFPSGNLRVGANFGFLGIVGKGFGLGINLNADVNLAGQTIIDANGYAALTATGTLGYALEILPDFLTIGADLRPMYRVYVPVSGQDAMSLVSGAGDIMDTMNAYSAYAGWGVGIDAGAIMELGDLKIGLTISDILDTRLNYNSLTVGEFMTGLDSGELPEGTPVDEPVFVIPMDVSAGVGYMFDLGFLGSLDVHGEISNVVRAARAFSDDEEFDYLSLVHAGANLNLFNFIGVMGGYNEGYLSAGVSLDLLFIEIAAAGFVQANTATVGYSDFGASIEAAIRF